MSEAGTLLAGLTPVTLVVGKGGVGKTTVASALATHFARHGERTLVVTTDPAATLFAALGRPIKRTPEPISLAPDLDGWTFDPERIRDEFLARWREPITQIIDRGTYLDVEDIAGLVDAALPGADEIFAVLALGDVLARRESNAYRRIVVDTAPTGHTLRLLDLPRSFGALVRLLDAMQEKHRFMVRALTHRYRADAADALIAELRQRVEALQTALTDPALTTAVLVARAEPVVMSESERYLGALGVAGVKVSAVVINEWTDTHAARAAIEPIAGALRMPPPLSSGGESSGLLSSAGVYAVPRLGDPVNELIPAVARLASPSRAKDKLSHTNRAASPSARSDDAIRVEALLKSLTIVGGKGGVGKTTVACALAIAVARPDNPTLLVSTDPAPSIGDALDLPIGDHETEVPDVPHLTVRQMDAGHAFTSFRDVYRDRIDGLFESLAGRGVDIAHDREIIRDLLALAPPGIDELYALSVLGDTLAEGRFSTIVVDPAPTGHLLRLLDMPALAVSWSHQLMRMMLKYKEVVGLGEAAAELLAFARRTRALEQRLKDPTQSTALLVTLDEPLVRDETTRLLAAMGKRSLSVSAVIWNRSAETMRPLPSADGIPQFVAPLREPAPVGVTAIREWIRTWQNTH